MTLRDIIAQLRAAEARATPGPWRHGRSVGRTLYGGDAVIFGLVDEPNDATLIALMRNALPALLAALDEREALLADMRRVVQCLADMPGPHQPFADEALARIDAVVGER